MTEKIIRAIQQDANLIPGAKIIVRLNRNCPSMLEDAFLLDAGGRLQNAFWTAEPGIDQADEAAIRLSEDGDDLVTFHETRPSSKDHRPNGIRVGRGELDFPCVVFFNGGNEPLTVDGDWIAPGGWTFIQERDINDPEVQAALADFLGRNRGEHYGSH